MTTADLPHRRKAVDAAEPSARRVILDVARQEITEHGFDGASIRNIARRAGVDPRLVRHYYGSRERLLLHAIQIECDPLDLAECLLAGSHRTLGQRVAEVLLQEWDNPRTAEPYRARMSASLSNDDVAAMTREDFLDKLFGTLAAAVSPDQPEVRAALAASYLAGLALCRHLVDDSVLARWDEEDLAYLAGRAIQQYLTAPLGPPR